ncbi:hypothetical protein MHYP_G00109840 [Metynnis hypsauchen]
MQLEKTYFSPLGGGGASQLICKVQCRSAARRQRGSDAEVLEENFSWRWDFHSRAARSSVDQLGQRRRSKWPVQGQRQDGIYICSTSPPSQCQSRPFARLRNGSRSGLADLFSFLNLTS